MRKSYIWAGLLALAMAGWLASGELLSGKSASTASEIPSLPESQKKKPFVVEVQTFRARSRVGVIPVRGRTQAYKTVEVRARTKGIIEASPVREGDQVKTGDLLCRLDLTNRKSQLAQAKAQMASAHRDFEATSKLSKKKFASSAKVASERARYDAAMAAIEQIEWDIKWTKVRAPLSGIVSERPAQTGSYLQVGQLCATITVLDPILIIGQVGERQIGRVRLGQDATARLVTGEVLKGRIRFIAPKADVATRTFRVEVEAANPDKKVRDGITAEIEIPQAASKAHLLPASTIGLNDAGQIGVRGIVDGDKVKFMPVKLVAQAREGAWVSGLPDEVTLITVGQDYVLDGQTVEPVEAGTIKDAPQS